MAAASGIRAGMSNGLSQEREKKTAVTDLGQQCVGCPEVAAAGRRRCSRCLEIEREKARRQRLRRKRQGLCLAFGCPHPAESGASVYCTNHRQVNRDRLKRYDRRRKAEVFEHYGGCICACCGEQRIEFLTLDHVHGGGNRHRREARIAKLAAWLKRNGYPPGFQVLCFNCNQEKGAGTECPHQWPEPDPEYCI